MGDREEKGLQIIAGRNPVIEALKSGREIDRIYILKDAEGSIKKITGMAKERRIPFTFVDREVIERESRGSRNHQGVVAVVAQFSYLEPEDILAAAAEKGEDPFVIILDNIEDPHNLGAIMRTADAVGAHGIIVPKRRAAGLTDTVAKASAGAIEYVPVARVPNISAAIDDLKKQGLWITAADMDGQTFYEADLKGPVGLVIGSEGKGVSRIVREHCDFIVSMPMKGHVNSLNASNAAAVLMYEICRQRDAK